MRLTGGIHDLAVDYSAHDQLEHLTLEKASPGAVNLALARASHAAVTLEV